MEFLPASSQDRSKIVENLKSPDTKIAQAAIEDILRPEMKADPFEQIMAALALYQTGKKDDAVFWFYLGQLGLRDLLTADPAEGGILQAFVMAGADITNHAMLDPTRFASVIDNVLERDRVTPNATRKDPAHRSKEVDFENNRRGLLELKASLIANRPALEEKAKADLYVASLSGWQRNGVEYLRAFVRASNPQLNEVIKWGHLVYYSNGPVLLIRAEEERVLFGFWRGKRLRHHDPRLKPSGEYEMATIELHERENLDLDTVVLLVQEAVALNASLGDPTCINPA